MANPLFSSRHIKEYLFYGILSGIAFAIPVWLFFYLANYTHSWLVHLGSILFMFVIMVYAIKLTRRRPDYQSTGMMAMAGHIAILVGIVVSVILSIILCFSYIPGFMGGNSDAVLKNAPQTFDPNNRGTVLQIFIAAIGENFGAGSFISLLVSYVLKLNQTKDKAAPL